MTEHNKDANTCLRVLETLKLLYEKEASINDIIAHLEYQGLIDKVYSNVAIFKYINTLKVFGINFEKKKDLYCLQNLPILKDFTEDDLRALNIIESVSRIIPENKLNQTAQKVINELRKVIADDKNKQKIAKIEFEIPFYFKKYEQQIKLCEKYIEEAQKLKLTANGITINCEPREIRYIDDKVYFRVFNQITNEMKDILISEIDEVVQYPSRSSQNCIPMTTIFKIKGRLARTYRLRNQERITSVEENGDMTIVSQFEDKNMLLHRLLRYDSLCEVISPKAFREKMIATLDKMLEYYE